jgi:hypothetical protein
MKQQWKNRNVDLFSLMGYIRHFFEEKQLKVVEKKLKDGLCIEVFSLDENPPGRLCVKILGTPNNFIIEILAGGEMPNILSLFPLLERLGLGFLILQKIRSEELLNKLEPEFWAFINIIIERLSHLSGAI